MEQWAYAGVRQDPDSEDQLIDYWFSNQGTAEETHWTARRMYGQRYVIGGIYSLSLTRQGTEITRHGYPRYTGEIVHSPQRLDWAAKDQRARLARQLLLEQASKHKGDVLEQALEPLKELINSRRTYPEREALMVTLLRRLMTD